MPTDIKISNYKSVFDLEIELGDVSIFIGENGCGKSNILEAIAFASAAANNKLDNEFLFNRGIRVTNPEFMRSAFKKAGDKQKIRIVFKEIPIEFIHNSTANEWVRLVQWDTASMQEMTDSLMENIINNPVLANLSKKNNPTPEEIKVVTNSIKNWYETLIKISRSNVRLTDISEDDPNTIITKIISGSLTEINSDFLIYSPEYSFLRNFETEGQIQPFGIRGEGVFKYLKTLIQEKNIDKLNEIKEHLQVFDWFDDIVTDNGKTFTGDYTLRLKDRYIDSEFDYFDHKSTNEGFLFVLFYICIMVHENTPEFFAIENIEASLNPKLCTELVKLLVKLSAKYNKKIILTTHNPAVLDGIDLKDDNQRLFRIYRNKSGHTKALRIADKSDIPEGSQVKLSEAFMRGYLGGLPTTF